MCKSIRFVFWSLWSSPNFLKPLSNIGQNMHICMEISFLWILWVWDVIDMFWALIKIGSREVLQDICEGLFWKKALKRIGRWENNYMFTNLMFFLEIIRVLWSRAFLGNTIYRKGSSGIEFWKKVRPSKNYNFFSLQIVGKRFKRLIGR